MNKTEIIKKVHSSLKKIEETLGVKGAKISNPFYFAFSKSVGTFYMFHAHIKSKHFMFEQEVYFDKYFEPIIACQYGHIGKDKIKNYYTIKRLPDNTYEACPLKPTNYKLICEKIEAT